MATVLPPAGADNALYPAIPRLDRGFTARVQPPPDDSTDHPEEVTMKSHRCRRIRALVLGLAACAAVAAPAGAQSAGDTPANSRSQATPTTKIGDTPADYPGTEATPTTKIGDTPVDHPGASRAPDYTPPTIIRVEGPERTIVRDVDEVLPVVLSSAALLLALGGYAFLLIASIRRRRPGH
jgi:hypothetical protein